MALRLSFYFYRRWINFCLCLTFVNELGQFINVICGIWYMARSHILKNLSKWIASTSMKKSEFNCIISIQPYSYLCVCGTVPSFGTHMIASNSDCPNVYYFCYFYYLFTSIPFTIINIVFSFVFGWKTSRQIVNLLFNDWKHIFSIILHKIEISSIWERKGGDNVEKIKAKCLCSNRLSSRL